MHCSLSSIKQNTYTINNFSIPFCHQQRDLGIIVQDNESWMEQYNYICSNAYRSFVATSHLLHPLMLKGSYIYIPCEITSYLLLSIMETPSNKRHLDYRKCSTSSFKVYLT